MWTTCVRAILCPCFVCRPKRWCASTPPAAPRASAKFWPTQPEMWTCSACRSPAVLSWRALPRRTACSWPWATACGRQARAFRPAANAWACSPCLWGRATWRCICSFCRIWGQRALRPRPPWPFCWQKRWNAPASVKISVCAAWSAVPRRTASRCARPLWTSWAWRAVLTSPA